MLLVPTYVASSDVEGVGVFAAEAIKKGTLLWRFNPTFDLLICLSDIEEMEAAAKEHLRRYAYPHAPDLSYVVYETDNGRFMNHSDAPNTDFSNPDLGYAARNIKGGEEITGDYRAFWPEYFLLPALAAKKAMNGNGAATHQRKPRVLMASRRA